MILLLSLSLKSLQAKCNNIVPLRGSECEDSVLVLIPIENIRIANVKLIEHKYLLEEVDIKDSIINLKTELLYKQENVLNAYKNSIVEVYNINSELNKSVGLYKRKFKIYRNISFVLGGSILLYMLLK